MQVKRPLLFSALIFVISFSAFSQNKTPHGISYQILKEGSGTYPEEGQEVKCHYVVSDADGNVIWSTRAINAPDFIRLGEAKSEMGKARDNCFTVMQKGSKYRFEFPKAMLDNPQAANLPGNFITYEIELLDFDAPKPSGVALFQKIKKEEGLKAALDRMENLCTSQSSRYALREGDLNRLGYQLLSTKEIEAAITIFQINVNLHPLSFNAYDSLGDAFASKGDKVQARVSFEKAIQINPDFETAKEKLRNL